MSTPAFPQVSPVDGTHVTLGRYFRTPAHPDVLVALGRAQYTFLSLEETVTAILYEAGVATLPETRGKMAGDKEQALQKLAARYRQHPDGALTAELLDTAVAAFRKARELVRNKLSHAHPYTAGKDTDGNYLPGLGYTVKDGTSWETLSSTPEDLLDFAAEVEMSISPLNAARMAVRDLPVSKLV
ncbi:hypothetical protein [Plantibacter sp. CFBP 8804]|uniref:hypothetical protein n=1 Tax=Plantibacter sp. CFBP 8804 TaxID=2775270 RepID=UPI001783CE47|nr:hypothetical protein [Plantibacter sp. CFBP 8804]MBD8519223.1 hypothetical protein [Plantibacter sp. CFBP 8804]